MADSVLNEENYVSVADMMGQVDPAGIENFEAGKVELSVPRKVVAVKKTPQPKTVVKAKPPLGKAVPVFQTETYVDEEGIEHILPPRYDKSKMNLPQAKFKRPENMPMIRDDDVVAAQIKLDEEQKLEKEEMPDFLKEWDKPSSDMDVNDILDNDQSLDFAVEGDDDEVVSSDKKEPIVASSLDEQDRYSLTNNISSDDEDIDMAQLDRLIAEQKSSEEKMPVLELGDNELLKEGDVRDSHHYNEIPKFDASVVDDFSDSFLGKDDNGPLDDLLNDQEEAFSEKSQEGRFDFSVGNVLEQEPEASETMVCEPVVAEPVTLSEDKVDDVVSSEPEPMVVEPVMVEDASGEAEPVTLSEDKVDDVVSSESESMVVEPVMVEDASGEAEPVVMSEDKVDDVVSSEPEPMVVDASVAHDVPVENLRPLLDATQTDVFVAPSETRLEAEKHYVQKYSGDLNTSYFVVSAQNFPAEFVAQGETKSLQINVGTSDYGWGVLFSNGILMGIADVRAYQLRHGKLPSSNGVLFYGTRKMSFTDVERIVLYQTPQYFSYV